jgi:hypothetical protein
MTEDYNIENDITSLLASLTDADHLDDEVLPETYTQIMRLMMKQFGVSAVVHQFMQIRFSSHGMEEDEAHSAANGFLMGLQMAVRHSEWARAIVNDMDEDPDLSSIAHNGQDSLARMLPME